MGNAVGYSDGHSVAVGFKFEKPLLGDKLEATDPIEKGAIDPPVEDPTG